MSFHLVHSLSSSPLSSFDVPKLLPVFFYLPPLAVVTPCRRTLANLFPPLLFRRPHRNLEIAHISLTGIYLMGSSEPCYVLFISLQSSWKESEDQVILLGEELDML